MRKTKKLNVAVFMGGRSAEHEVSLHSGSIVIQSLDKSKYNLKRVVILKNGMWKMASGFRNPTKKREKILRPGAALDQLIKEKINAVFIALHGTFGEDGTIQGMLEMVNIPYTGSNVLSSSLAMHKVKTLEMYEYYSLPTPKRITFTR